MNDETQKVYDAHFTSVISFMAPSMQRELQKRWMKRTRRKTVIAKLKEGIGIG